MIGLFSSFYQATTKKKYIEIPLLVFNQIKDESLGWPHGPVHLHRKYRLIKLFWSSFGRRHLLKGRQRIILNKQVQSV